jgi:nuclear RNA export factor
MTFPDLKNLSLEGNLIEDLKGLEGWRSRFRGLEQLILSGNPVTSLSNYKDEMIRRYPKLIMLDNVVVDRPQIQIGDQNKSQTVPVQNPSTAVDANGRPILPLPVKGNLLVDHNGLAMSFLSE